MWRIVLLLIGASLAVPEENIENDGETSRKVLGSSVVTSVSVIMDTGNGSKIYSDAVGKPVSKPATASDLASPIDLLNPDRYEFYTFDDSGDLVKRLMTLDEIQGIIASGDGDGFNLDSLASQGFLPEKRVNDVVNNVQNVLKSEMESHKNITNQTKFDTPDVSDSWSMILPAIFGNSGEDIKPEKPAAHVTPDTIMIEPTTQAYSGTTARVSSANPILVSAPQLSTTQKLTTFMTSTKRTISSTTEMPKINVEITTNSNASTEKTTSDQSADESQVIEIKPLTIIESLAQVTVKPTRKPASSTRRPLRPTLVSMKKPPTRLTTKEPEPSLPTLLQILNTAEPKTPETVTDQPSTTYSSLTTFFIVTDTRTETTPAEDLSTLESEYPTETTDKLKVTSNLEQFLLTSTNIYEINTELAKNTNQSDVEEDKTTTESAELKIRDTTIFEPTTEQSLISSIEQIISQTMGNVEEPIIQNVSNQVVEEMIDNSSNKGMLQIKDETATLASNLVGIQETTTEKDIYSTILGETDIGSLLSQLMSEPSYITTDLPTTREAETRMDPAYLPTSELLQETTETIKNNKVRETTIETTTEEDVETTTEDLEHIINITIIRHENRKNQSFSLEQNYKTISEVNKNSSQELLKTEASSSIQEPFSETTTIIETTSPEVTTQEITTELETTKVPTVVQNKVTTPKPSVVLTINEVKQNVSLKTGLENGSSWTLVSTLSPFNDIVKEVKNNSRQPSHPIEEIVDSPNRVDLTPKPLQGFGLEDSTSNLDPDIYHFVQLCNELAFGFWRSVTSGISTARSVVVSPFAATSLLAMVFLGARGATSGEMNEILKLDDMVSFNPHLIFKNVSESIEVGPRTGIAVSAIIRELFSDRSKGKLLNFYKERAKQFYDGHVEEAGFREIGDTIRRRTNLLVKKQTQGKIAEYLKDSSIVLRPPLAGISSSIFHTDCSQASTEGRDGELHFVVLPSIRQRRLIPIPAVVFKSGFLAGYEPSLDATAVAFGSKQQTISTIFVIPGQQGIFAPGDGLARLEKRLVESSFKKGAWSRLLRNLIPRPGLEVQIPLFSHRSVINATVTLKKMGLRDLFDSRKADLRGLNGVAHELHLSDMLQVNNFATCGENRIGDSHHSEIYPATADRSLRKARNLDNYNGESGYWVGEEPRDYQRAFHDPSHDPSYLSLPLSQRPRQARLPEIPRLRFDRPFLYFVRYNPNGLILHMGRFHPRLLP